MVMLDFNKLKGCVKWRLVRSHLCTLAVSVSFNCTWRTPREGFRYGGLQFFIALTVAMVFVALPTSLLHLAVGQLSQQDAVGIWKAVPFFKGIGYLRLLVSFIGSIYTIVYLGFVISCFLYTANNSITFPECTSDTSYDINVNTTEPEKCLNGTFLAPLQEIPEYYMAIMFMIIVLAIVFPILFYSSIKLMKRFFYLLGPVIIILGVVIVSCIGNRKGIETFLIESNWRIFYESNIWYSALIQALLSTQLSGGYLILSGDSLYSDANIQWTALLIVSTNIISSLAGLLFWFAISGENKDTSCIAVLIQTYATAQENGLAKVFPMLILAMLFLSGAITMLTFSYPLFDRVRRICEHRWRIISMASSLVGAGIALSILSVGLPTISILEYTVVPLLLCITVVVEVFAFILIYGLKTLIQDVEFLIDGKLLKYWPFGWWVAPSYVIIFTTWWLVDVISTSTWSEPSWETSALIATALLSTAIFLIIATISVLRQVQYDIFDKFISSFTPSRHWGPRDPIAHYYWSTQRLESDEGNLNQTKFRRCRPARLSGVKSVLSVIPEIYPEHDITFEANVKRRTNSDDWIYNEHRKRYISDTLNNELNVKNRSTSLDMNVIADLNMINNLIEKEFALNNYSTPDESITSVDTHINVVAVIETKE